MDGDHDYCRPSSPPSTETILSTNAVSEATSAITELNREQEFDGQGTAEPPSQPSDDKLLQGMACDDGDADLPGTTGRACFLCHKMYTTKSILNRHLKLKHDIGVTSSYRSLHCPVPHCFLNFNFMSHLRHHISNDHGFQVSDGTIVLFKSEAEFKEWKTTEERLTLSKYIKKHGRRRTSSNSVEVEEYMCNRSGFHESGGRGLRKAKAQGSVKMNSICPSTITAYFRPLISQVEVKYFPTHFGHDRDLLLLCLTKQEKYDVDKLISDGASADSVLDAVRCHDDGAVRTLAASHIKNAESVFDMMVDQLPAVECESVEGGYCRSRVAMLLKELQELGSDNPILEKATVTDAEILAFTMSAFQAQLLKQFGDDGVVCVDHVSSTSFSKLSVTSVSVILADQSAFPCAFCIHVRQLDQGSPSTTASPELPNYLSRFLCAIRARAGRLKPRVLITSECPSLLDCWTSAMDSTPPDRNVMAPWAVDRDWRRSLCRASKKLVKQAVIYKSLHRLLHESDRAQFEQLSNSFARHIADRSYGKLFLKYFKHTYANHEHRWAYSFQPAEHAEQCDSLEPLHLALSAILADWRVTNVDVVFHVIFRLVRQQSLMRTSLLSDDKIGAMSAANAIECHRVTTTSDREAAEVFEVVFNSQWLVRTKADDSPGDYIVDRSADICPFPRNGDCGIRCSQCDLCVHNFLCTCVDSVVRGDICKHVHLVAYTLRSVAAEESIIGLDVEIIEIGADDVARRNVDDTDCADRDVDIIATRPVINIRPNLEPLRADVRNYCATIVEYSRSVDDVQVLVDIRDAIKLFSESLR